ncbi:MAG: EAL domain-containing protein [Thiomicrorhabdus sp.]|nr:EAL domain-containing protein [Thiomicrorhabdus sp.]
MNNLTQKSRHICPKYLCNHYKQWSVIAISLFFILFLFQKTFNPLLEQRSEILSDSFFVSELQYAILKNISMNQLNNSQSFDSLNHQVNTLKQTLKSLKKNPAIEQYPDLKQKLTELINSAHQQRHLIEQFKTNHSVLQNSLHFFPSAYEHCIDSLKTLPNQQTLLAEQLKSTLIAGLMIIQNSHSGRLTQLEKALNKLEQQTPLTEACQIFIQHSHLILEYTPKVHQIHNQLSQLKIDQKIHAFYTQLEASTAQVMAKNQTYYLIILIFTIFLLIYIGITLTSLFRSNQKLKMTLTSLSEKQALFEALVKASSAITQSTNKQDLYQQITNIATQESLFDACWIGEVSSEQTVIPVAYAGKGKEYFKELVIPLDSTDIKNSGTVLECYLHKKPIITNHYPERMKHTSWAKLIQKFGIQGNATLPIIIDDHVIAILVVYTQKSNFFNKDNNEFLFQLLHDISIALERFQAQEEQALYQQNLAISAIAFESHEAMIITDKHAQIIRSNQAFNELTGYTQQEVLGKTPNILKSELHTLSFYKALWEKIYTTGAWQGEIWNRKKDGTLYPCWQSISAVLDSKGRVTHYISHALDLTKDKKAQREINRLNYHDKLTNLPNRSLLIDRLEQALSQSHQYYSVLILININRFKLFNDSLGHSAGDELLIKVAQRLQTLDFEHITNLSIARIGNDEFSITCLSQTASLEEVLLLAEHIAPEIQRKLAEPFTIQEQSAMIDISMGVTLFTPCNKTAEALLQEANTALDRAKKIAKQTAQSTIQFYDSSMQQQTKDHLKLENQLRTALTNQEFRLQYQPQIALKSGAIIGVETLIRWQKQDGTLVPPNDFIPALEESGLIIPVGMWVIEKAITQALRIHKTLPDLTMSINLSAIQFNDKELINKVQSLLEEYQYPPKLLEFEVTESLLMSDIEETIKKLNAFADLGIKIAIDDFGTGYSSLAYLKRFPVSKLKIDKAFIDDITQSNSSDPAIVQATIQMTKALGITTIAEGVEEQDQLDILNKMGCDEIQGYFFSRPLAPNDLQDFILKHMGTG